MHFFQEILAPHTKVNMDDYKNLENCEVQEENSDDEAEMDKINKE